MIIETIVLVLWRTLVILILLKVLLSYFMDPFHPFRQSIDRIIEPLLNPIRRIIPSFGRFDFSPLILLILVEVVARILLDII
jgi:YggT family protein